MQGLYLGAYVFDRLYTDLLNVQIEAKGPRPTLKWDIQ
jgi:hypothetical protein